MREHKFAFLRMFAVVAAVSFAFMGMMASPAAAAQDTVGACQIVSTGDSIPQDADCGIVYDSATDSCILVIDGAEYDGEGACDAVEAGNCPYQLITEIDGDTVIVQVQCTQGTVPTATSPAPTATDVPPTATDVPATATDVPATATDVPATATDVPATSTGTVTATATATATSTDTDTETDTDKDSDTDTTTNEEVAELPTTGQGPDNGQTGAVVLVLGAVSMLLAGAAFAWQRRSVA